MPLTFAPRTGGFRMKIRGPFADPFDEFLKPRVAAQRLDRIIAAGQFSLGHRRVDFVMTNLMQQNDRPALTTFQLWDQMMQALLGVLWDRAVTQGADRRVFHSVRSSASGGFAK